MKVIILAAGKATRFGSNKQFIPIGEETLIERMCRQIIERGHTPIVVTQNKNLQKHCKKHNYKIFKPKYYDTFLHTFLFSSPLWDGEERVILLWGDVIFTDNILDKIFLEKNLKIVLTKKDTLGMIIPFKYYNMIKEKIKSILKTNPKDSKLAYRLYLPLKKEFGKSLELFADEISRDIDTKEELHLFNTEVILNNKL